MVKKAAAKKTSKKKVAKKKVGGKKVVSKATTRKSSTRKSETPPDQGYANEVWLAGLGAFSLARKEGGRLYEQGRKTVGETSSKVLGESNDLFERLVREGRQLEEKGRKAVDETVDGVRDEVESRVGKVRDSAQTGWNRLEGVFEQRVARALSRLGVPTSDEVRQLSERVAELKDEVRALSARQKKSGGTSRKTTGKTTARPAEGNSDSGA